jgi:hypothetical protein
MNRNQRSTEQNRPKRDAHTCPHLRSTASTRACLPPTCACRLPAHTRSCWLLARNTPPARVRLPLATAPPATRSSPQHMSPDGHLTTRARVRVLFMAVLGVGGKNEDFSCLVGLQY